VDDVPFLIQVLGDSGSGKTLVVERCARALVRRGLTVAVVKHSHHSPDLEGKDSERFASTGAELVLFSGPRSFLSFAGAPDDLVRSLPVDVILVEGYSKRKFGVLRYTIRRPDEAPSLVRRILRETPRRARRPELRVDGKSRRTDPLWRFVANLMTVRGAREIRRKR
jgi:molybdopterin-guanine dinucleotide biosynthesis adapter protein